MVELVTGHANKAHATAEQAAGLNAGILGLDDYVLNVHDKFELTVVSANKVTIGTGELVMQGRHVSQGTPEDLIVTNGSQGQKRNDLIVCRYAKGSQSIESAELVVVRGTPTTGTPTDPTLNTTSPLDGGTTYDMPLYRIPLDGITIGTPVPLFNVLRPISDVWDSVTLYNSKGFTVIRTGMMMLVKYSGNIGNGSWDALQCEYVLPTELRPPIEVNAMVCVSNGQTARTLSVNPNGTIRVANMGAAGSNQGCVGSLCYPIP